jgi:nucleotide-binding universal stress UspA family protein
MYERILVPLDGSGLSEQALPYVNLLGKSLHARIELLRVYGTMSIGIGNNRDQAREYVNDIKGRLEADGLGVSAAALEGNPASLIVSEAQRGANTLIAMSTRARMGIARWILGSVTDEVLRATSNPLLLVRSRDQDGSHYQAGLRSIIVPLDGSPLAEQILPHAVSLAQTLDLSVTLVRVVPDDQEDDSKDYLSGIAGRLHIQGVNPVEQLILRGHAGQAIIEVAQGMDEHLLAITTHGRSGVGRVMRREGDTLMLGSIADRMVKHSGGPVLILNTAG